MTPEEYRHRAADGMPEKDLLDAVTRLAKCLSWLVYHTHRSDRSPAGFPDLVLVRDGRLVFAELKRQKRSNPTPAQVEWLNALGLVESYANANDRLVTVHLWRPLDLLDGTIEGILRRVE